MKIFKQINILVDFAQKHLMLNSADKDYVINKIVDMLSLPTFEQTDDVAQTDDINILLADFVSAAVEDGVFPLEEQAYWCDKIMGELSALPSEIDAEFTRQKNVNGNDSAMQWLYKYCVDNTYVKRAVLDKNPRFDADNGLVVTINLAKPEFRDPKKAQSGNSVKGGYPKCVICRQNQGLVSRNKCSLRTVSVTLDGKQWFWQFSPYGYFNQHGICVNTVHTPMHVDRQTFINLMDFVDQFPGYFIGCNAALERIGGSVLAHDHYQGGGEELPLFKASIKQYVSLKGYDDLKIGVLNWPGTVIRIVGSNKQHIVQVADIIRNAWEVYNNEDLGIIAKTDVQHNAVSPTVIKRENVYELNIILRSNITSTDYPDGVFHAHPEFHVIKKESIGLIEAQGLFILPGRLVKQLACVEQCILNGSLTQDLADFSLVYNETKLLVKSFTAEGVHKAMEQELASICYRILQNTAVFKDYNQTLNFLEGIGFER